MKIKHVKFGEGTIISVKGSGKNTVIDVAFKGVGIKSLVAALAPIEVIEKRKNRTRKRQYSIKAKVQKIRKSPYKSINILFV